MSYPESLDFEDLYQHIESMGQDPNGWYVDYDITIHGYIDDIRGSGGDMMFFYPGDQIPLPVGTTKSIHNRTYYVAATEQRDIGDKKPYIYLSLLTKYPPPEPPIIWSAYNGELFSGTFIINFGKTYTIPDEWYDVERTFDGVNFHYLVRIKEGPFVDYNVPPLTYVGYRIRTYDRYQRYSPYTDIVWSVAPWNRYDVNPVLLPGFTWDSWGHFSPFVAFDVDTYHLFCSGGTGLGTGYAIGHWTLSKLDWELGNFDRWLDDISNPVLTASGSGFMQNGVAESSLLRYGNLWWQFFTGYDNHNAGGMDAAGIGLAWAQSLNGPWHVVSDTTPLIPLGGPGEWDDYDVFGSNAAFKGQQFILYYSGGASAANAWRIGLATAGSIVGPYTKYGGNPVLNQGLPGEWDSFSLNHPRVIDWEDWLIIHFNGNDTPLPSYGKFQIGESYTENYSTIIKTPFNPCLGVTELNEANLRIGFQIFRKPGTNEYFNFYSATNALASGAWINLARLWR